MAMGENANTHLMKNQSVIEKSIKTVMIMDQL